MSPIRFLALCLGTVAVLLAFHPREARAETYQTCAGFIDALPATITTQGVWCLRKDLGTAMASGWPNIRPWASMTNQRRFASRMTFSSPGV